MSDAVCDICPHLCHLKEGQTGCCGARVNRNGKVVCDSYGWLTSIALDPIEKKPLRRFHPGAKNSIRRELRVQSALSFLPKP